MTLKEQIMKLQTYKMHEGEDTVYVERDDVLKALEQEPGDAISRVDALKALDYDIKSFEFKSGVDRHMNEIADLLNTIYEIQSDNIKALPPVQPKPIECEDAISMMDLLNNLHKHFSKGFETDEWWNSTHVLQAVKDCRPELFDLNYVSSVQPKPKIGHWIDHPQGEQCSECGLYVIDHHNDNYCPNCGAKMVKSNMLEIPTGSESENKIGMNGLIKSLVR